MAVVWRSETRGESAADEGEQFAYVRRLGVAVRSAIAARRRLTDELARHQKLGTAVLPELGRVASACGHEFDEARWIVSVAPTPRGAEMCTDALRHWLALHVEACDAVARAAGTGDQGHMRAAHDLLHRARPFALQFNRVREFLADRLVA